MKLGNRNYSVHFQNENRQNVFLQINGMLCTRIIQILTHSYEQSAEYMNIHTYINMCMCTYGDRLCAKKEKVKSRKHCNVFKSN